MDYNFMAALMLKNHMCKLFACFYEIISSKYSFSNHFQKPDSGDNDPEKTCDLNNSFKKVL